MTKLEQTNLYSIPFDSYFKDDLLMEKVKEIACEVPMDYPHEFVKSFSTVIRTNQYAGLKTNPHEKIIEIKIKQDLEDFEKQYDYRNSKSTTISYKIKKEN